MDDIGPPPASCPHCGHDDPNEFLPMGGAYFCGACGKKLTTTSHFDAKRITSPTAAEVGQVQVQEVGMSKEGEEGREGLDERKEKEDQLITPVKKEDDKGGFFSRLSGSKKRGEENKENTAPQPSPTPSSQQNQPSNLTTPSPLSPSSALRTPTKSPLAASAQSTPSFTSPTSPLTSSPLTSPLASPLSNSPSPAFTVSTPARSTPIRPTASTPLASPPPFTRPAPTPSLLSSSSASSSSSPDIAALTLSLRRELQQSFDREQEILNMERDELDQRVSALTSERDQLQAMVEQVMTELQAVVDEGVQKRNDYMATMGILEAELTMVRDSQEREHVQLRDATAVLDDAQRQIHEQSMHIDDLKQQLSSVSAELDDLKLKHASLRDTATAKLKASAQEYMAIRQREQEKDILLHEIRRELQSAMEKNVVVGSRCKDAEERSERLAGEVTALEEELKETREGLVGMSRELGDVKGRAEEWRGKAEEMGAIAQRYKEQVLEQREKMRGMERERRGGGGGGGGGVEEERLRQENGQLRGELERKEAENRELMEMVESLIAQVEQKDMGDHNETY